MNEINLLGNTELSVQDFLEFTNNTELVWSRGFLRKAIAHYLHKRIKVEGCPQDPEGDYDQWAEDIMIILAYKGAKDFVYLLNRESIAVEDIDRLLFKSKPNLLEYVNSIYNAMLNYIAKTIIDNGLSFSQKELLKKDPDSFKLKGPRSEFGLDPRSFFFMKYAYEGDSGAAHEDLENFGDFSEFRPIATAKISFD